MVIVFKGYMDQRLYRLYGLEALDVNMQGLKELRVGIHWIRGYMDQKLQGLYGLYGLYIIDVNEQGLKELRELRVRIY